MHFLENFYFRTIKYDLINKFVYKKTKKIPVLKKIVLNFSSKTINNKKLFSSLLALELTTNQKSVFTTSKNSNISSKIQKGNPVGCKLTLQKFNSFNFFGIIVLQILPKFKNINKFILNKKINKNSLSFKFSNIFSFSELEKHYYFFNNLPKLNITLITTTKNKKELIFFCKLFQFSD